VEERESVEALAERMLTEAYDLVLDGWCQGMSARDEAGRPIEPSSAFARAWSASGALERLWRRSSIEPDRALKAFERANLALATAVKDVPQHWNDAPGRTKDEVLYGLLDAARRVSPKLEESLVEDLLDDLDRYQESPAFLLEN
jgi:hypothetical protein